MVVGLREGVVWTPTRVVTTTKLINVLTQFWGRCLRQHRWWQLLLCSWSCSETRRWSGCQVVDWTPWLLLEWLGGRMGSTGQVGTATDLAQLIPSKFDQIILDMILLRSLLSVIPAPCLKLGWPQCKTTSNMKSEIYQKTLYHFWL